MCWENTGAIIQGKFWRPLSIGDLITLHARFRELPVKLIKLRIESITLYLI